MFLLGIYSFGRLKTREVLFIDSGFTLHVFEEGMLVLCSFLYVKVIIEMHI